MRQYSSFNYTLRFIIVVISLVFFNLNPVQAQCTITPTASEYCDTDGSSTLVFSPATGTNTSGGIVTGAGISDADFDPSAAGLGTHTITYRSYEVDQTGTYSWSTLSSSDIGLGDDDSDLIRFPSGFTFTFFDTDYTEVYISSNGYLSFFNLTLTEPDEEVIPDTSSPLDIVAFAWDNWDPSDGGTVRHQTLGSAPNRIFVVEYANIPHWISGGGSTNTISTQVKLFETTNVIEIHTEHLDTDVDTRVQGIEGINNPVANNVIDGSGIEWYVTPSRNDTDWSIGVGGNDFVSYTPCTVTTDITVLQTPSTGLGVSAASSTICSGESTTIDVVLSDPDVNYQLQTTGGVDVGSYVAGTGGTINLPTGNLTSTTSFRVIANPDLSCETTLTNTATITVNVLPPTPTISSSDSATCDGTDPDVTLTSSVAPNLGTYIWYKDGVATGDTGQTLDISSSANNGDYTVIVIDGSTSCQSGQSMAEVVTINDLPSTTLTINYSTTNLCAGETITVEIVNSESGINYQVFDNTPASVSAVFGGTGTNLDIATSTLPSTQTSLFVRATNGTTTCSDDFASHAIIVNVLPTTPTINTSGSTVCDTTNPDVKLTSSSVAPNSGSYVWYKEGVTTGDVGISIDISNPVNSGDYTVATVDGISLCESAQSAIETVTINVAVLITASATDIICNGDTDGTVTGIGSSGTGTLVYTLETGAGAATGNTSGDVTGVYSGLGAGIYRVRITDANGCTTVSGNITITDPILLTTSTTESDYNTFNISCSGDNDGYIEVTATGGTGDYTFDLNSGTEVQTQPGAVYRFNNLIAGAYTVDIADANGCTTTQLNVTLTEPGAIIATGAVTNLKNGADISCTGDSNGELTISASNGSSGYSYVLNEDLANTSGNATGIYTRLSAGSYTVTVTDSNGCDVTTTTITLTDPLPIVNTPTANITLLCNGDTDGSGTFTASGGTASYTFSVDANTAGASVAASAATTQDFTNAEAGLVTMTATDANGCSQQQTITISEPALSVTGAISGTNSICPYTNTNLTFTLSGNGANFDVIYRDGLSDILLTNITTGHTVSVSPAATTTYTLISVTDLSTGCNSATFSGSAIITVSPSPATESGLSFNTACSDENVGITLSLEGGGSATSWDISLVSQDGNVTGTPTTGNGLADGAISTDVFNNISNTSGEVVYQVIPNSSGGCSGSPFNVTVTINPEPVGVVAIAAECSDVALNYNLQNNVIDSNRVLSTFVWEEQMPYNANVTGASQTPQSGSTISDIITNTTGTDQDVVYVVTPTSATGGCVGNDFVITITINSEPVGADDATTMVCSDVAFNYDLQANVNAVNGMSSTFLWVAAPNPDVTGESVTPQAGATITDILTNQTNANKVVTYTVTPTGANGCLGNTFDINITVYPEPLGADETINTCSDIALSYDLQNNVNTSGNGLSSTFTWVATNNPNVAGETISLQSTATITDNITNVSGLVQTVIYTVAPVSADANTCTGDSFTITVTIDPKPVGVASTDNTCSDVALSHSLQSDISNSIVSSFTWVAVSDNTFVTGESLGTQTSSTINDVITNTTGVDQVVVYNVIPTDAGTGCVGDMFTVTVTVESEPVGADNATFAECSNIALSYDLQNNINANNGVISTFSWIAAENGNTTGESLVAQAGSMINDVVTNITGVDQVVTYTVTPTSTTGNCVGSTFDINITIYSEPVGTDDAVDMCSDMAFNYDLQNNVNTPRMASSFNWIATDNLNVSGESLTNQSGDVITDILTNLTGSDQTVVYTVTPTDELNNCTGGDFTITITVYSEPIAANAIENTCSDIALAHNLQGDITNGLASSFSWIAADNPNTIGESLATQTTSTIVDAINNPTNIPQVIVYTVTPTDNTNSCIGDPYTVTVTVDPEPVGVADTDSGCSDVALSYDLQDNVVNSGNGLLSEFAWEEQMPYNANVTGSSQTPQSGSTISDIITNATGTDQDVVYVVTPTSATGGCVGNDFVITITINSEPVGADDATTMVCSDVAFNYDLQANVNAVNGMSSTFLWVAAPNPDVTGESVTPQAGATITDILTNQTNANKVVTYTVTPTGANGCLGNTFDINITVYPEPLGADETINTCSDIALSYDLQNNVNTSGNGLSSTFTWVATNNPNVAGETISLQSTATITDNITNVSGLVQTVIYTVAPVSADANTCTGDSFTITVTIDPKPVGVASTDNTCSDVALSHSLQSDISNSIVSSFTWVAVSDNTFVTGESLGTQTSSTINDVITNTTGVDQVVVYNVIPTDAGTGCVGDMFTVTVTVESEPVGADNATFAECSNIALSYDLQNNINANNGVISTFSWIAAENGNTTGESLVAQAGSMINDVVTNITGVDQVVTYTVTPTSTTGNCVGSTFDINITIYSEPVGTDDAVDMCSDMAFNYDLQNNVNTPRMASSFNWIATDNPNTTGESLVAQSGAIITDVITNVSGSDEVVVYNVTPTDNTNNCVGDVFTVSVTVHSEPLALNVTDNTCSNVVFAHDLQFDITNGMASTFSWVAASNTNVIGESTTTQNGSIINDMLQNLSSIQQTVIYTVTPTSDDAFTCVGNDFTVTVTVDPEPVGVNDTADGCSDVALNYNLQNNVIDSNRVLSTFVWEEQMPYNANVTGASQTPQSGTVIDDVITNPTTIDQVVVYEVIPTSLSIFGSCEGDPFTVTVTVRPEPASVDVVDATCSDVALSYDLQTGITNGLTSTFLWSAAGNPLVSGESVVVQAGDTINDVLTNVSHGDEDVVYTVIPTASNGCEGDPFTVTITVYSEPLASNVTDNTCSDVAHNHDLQADITNGLGATTTFSWSAADNINVAGESTTTQTTSTITDVITNLAGTTQTVIYIVTPIETTNNCIGDPFTVSVTVDPEPVGVSTIDNVCSDDALAHNLQLDISNGLTSNFLWEEQMPYNINVIGVSQSPTTGAIINDIISNPTNADEVVVYEVTPVDNANSCAGDIFTVTVTVSPLPTMSITDNAGFTGEICSGSSTGFKLNSTTVGAIIRLDNISNTAGVIGFSTAGSTFADGNDIRDVLTNTTDNPVTITYEFSVTVGGCDDKVLAFTKNVTVNPNPSFTITNVTPEICSGDAVDITLNSNTTGHQINLVGVTYGAVTGGTTAGSYVDSNQITDILNNTTNDPITVTYEFNVTTLRTTPVCPLVTTSQFTTVIINPDPVFSVINNSPSICSDEATDIDIASTTTNAIITLTAITVPPDAGSLSGLPSVGSTYLNGANLGNTISNGTNAIQTISYDFQVSVDGCSGGIENRTITVLPTPSVELDVAAQTICDGEDTNIGLDFDPNQVVGTSFSWTVVHSAGVSGGTDVTGAGSDMTTIAQTLTNGTNTPSTTTYTITPEYEYSETSPMINITCQGTPQTIIVTVNPTPTIDTSVAIDEVICSGSMTGITLQPDPLKNVAGTTYSWVASLLTVDNVTGATAGSGTAIVQQLETADGINSGTVVYQVTPHANGCDGVPFDVTVTVNSIAVVDAIVADAEVCEDEEIQLIASITGATNKGTWTGGNNSSGFSNGGTTVDHGEAITYAFDQVDINAGFVTFTLTSEDPDLMGPCTTVNNQVTVIINELPNPMLGFAGLNVINQRVDTVAEADMAYTLIGDPSLGSGLNGVYSGDGIVSGTFDPAISNLNMDNLVTYTFTDLKGCTNAVTDTVFVKAKPNIPELSVQRVCYNSIDIILEQPLEGEVGIWSGTGVTESGGIYTFDPSAAGLGIHIIQFDIVVNGSPGQAEQIFRVIPSPDVAFAASNFCVDDEIQFMNTSSVTDDPNRMPGEDTQITEYRWEFGDGQTISGFANVPAIAQPLRKYAVAGTYNVSLEVTTTVTIAGNDYECSSTLVQSVTIGVKPTADFDFEGVCGDDPTKFTDQTILNGSTITTYTWDFGDGVVISGVGGDMVMGESSTTDTYQNPLHQYAVNGVYNVTLTVETDLLCTSTSIQRIGILPFNGTIFPYFEDFEADNGGWVRSADSDVNTSYQSDTSWVYGEPNGSLINDSGNKVWWTGKNMITNGKSDTTYFANESSYINGSCFDLSSLKRPMISMDAWADLQEGFDGVVLQYSTGSEWINVGFINEGLSWYDGQGIPGMARNQLLGRYGWTKNTNGWESARFSLEHIPIVDRASIRFRIAFGTDANTPEFEVHNGFAFDNVFIGEKTRNILIEHFTNANANGADADQYLYDIFDDQVSTLGDTADFVLIQYHLGVPNPDVLNDDNIEDPGARAFYYGFSEGPRTVMDGLVDFSGNTFLKIDQIGIDSLALKDPVFSIALDTITTSRNEIGVEVVLTANEGFSEDLIMNVAVVENQIVNTNGTYRSVLKKLLFGSDGKVISSVWDAGSSGATHAATWEINIPIYDQTQLGLVAFVQNKLTKEVYQTVYLKAQDKERRPITGISDGFTEAVEAMKFYPNPVQDELSIINSSGTYGNYYVEIVDQRGVKILSEDMTFTNGEHKINTSSIPNGVYYVVIGVENRPVIYHKIVVADRK